MSDAARGRQPHGRPFRTAALRILAAGALLALAGFPATVRADTTSGANAGADTPAATPAPSAAPAASAALAPEPAGFSMTARALLQGHARPGAWMALTVDLGNDGPPITGELRMLGGTQGNTRFSVPVDLPTTSRKSYAMYVQAPVFGSKVDVSLVAGDKVIARRQVAFALHDVSQLSVGVVAERSGDLIAGLGRVNDPTAPRPAVFALTPADLPIRPEAWAPIDRLVWQDVDAGQLTAEQLAALRTWVAGGGRLTIVGGTAGANVLGGFPDELLPYRPAATIDVEPAVLRTLVGGTLPANAAPVAALAGTLRAGRAIAKSGEQAIVAEMAFGVGGVAVVGFDPTTGWLGGTDRADAVWQRVVPGRAGATSQLLVGDDSQWIGTLQQIPSLTLPPIEGLLLLIVAYILLVGPVNYLVLRRLDRREWAWVSIPLIVAGGAVAAFAIGSSLRGTDVIVNEMAVVRGAPGTDAGQAQVFLGIFSPSRTAYDVTLGKGALITAPVSDFTGTGTGGSIDVVQSDPATVRGLTVAYGSMRTIRADAAVSAPRTAITLTARDGKLQGTVRNDSAVTLEAAVVVYGSTTARLGDIAPGATVTVDTPITATAGWSSLSERVFGSWNGWDGSASADQIRQQVRRQLVDALTYDPFSGSSGTLPTAGPILLAWGKPGVIDVTVKGARPQTTGETIYYIPVELELAGRVAFTPDLVRVTIVDSKAQVFQKDPTFIGFGNGSVVLAYRPVTLSGTLTEPKLTIGVNTGDPNNLPAAGKSITPDPVATPAPSPSPSPTASPSPSPGGTFAPGDTPVPEVTPAPTPNPTANDTVPAPVPDRGPVIGNGTKIEIYDLVDAGWRVLSGLQDGGAVEIAQAERFVDAATGTVLIRMTNANADGGGLQFSVKIEGVIR